MKKLISFILVITIISSMLVFPASAKNDVVTDLSDLCTCGCGQRFENVQWKLWKGNEDTETGSGHYYLESDYVQNAQIVVNSGVRVVIDLRGHKLTTKESSRLMLVYGYAAVLDSVGGGVFCAKTTGSGFGGVLMLSVYETFGSTFELHGGTIMPDDGSKGSRRGGLVTVGSTCTFRMYGGQLLNGTTYSQLADYAETKDNGGAIYGDGGSSIEILGGQILNCKSDSYGGAIYSMGNAVLKDCVIRGGYAASGGGNVCMNGGTLTVENVKISDGATDATSNGGGNICLMSSAEMILKDSTVRNGYSAFHGGNIYFGSGFGTVENSVVEDGAARARGANIYGSTSAKGLTLRNCALPGDVSYVGKDLKLEGKVTVGVLNNGLRLWYGDTRVTMDASGLTEGSLVYVDANHTFATDTNPEYFKGAIRCVLSQTEDGITGTQAADGEAGGYCPHCGENAVWYAFSTTGSLVQNCLNDAEGDTDAACTGRHMETGHYYVSETMTGVSQYYIGVNGVAAKDVVLDLNGKSLTSPGRLIYTRVGANSEKSTFTLMDSYGSGSVTGSGVNNQGGGVLYNEGTVMNIYGGTVKYKESSTRYVASGGVIYNGGELNIYGGVVDASGYAFRDNSTSSKTYSYTGGAIFMSTGSARTLNMTAGRVEGGTAVEGGSLYINYNNRVEITGGQFAGGRATKHNNAGGAGGNIRVAGTSTNKSGTLKITGALLTGGYSGVYGGNINATYFTTINVTDCFISDGETADYGGNVSLGVCANTTKYTDCIIISGKAVRGGNVYTGGTGNRADLINCQVLYGTASNYAGNINAGNGYMTIQGGVVQGGKADTYGGNISCSMGKVLAGNYLKVYADDKGNVPMIVGGVAGTNGGNIYQSALMELDALVHNGKAAKGADIYYAATTSSHKSHGFTVGAATTGDISMYAETAVLAETIYGQPVANTVCSTLNATITLENVENNPLLTAKSGTLYVGSVAVVDKTGNSTWYATNADAIAACKDGQYVKMFIDGSAVLTKDCVIDLNGNDIALSGAYTVYGMDSKGAGKATLAPETLYVSDHFAPDGKRYLADAGETAVTWHALDMYISSVSLRPGAAGIYYNAVWNVDDVLAGKIKEFGVALSLSGMPAADFVTEGTSLYTRMTDTELVSGKEMTSCIIGNILRNDATYEQDGTTYTGAAANDLRGQLKIYATPYVLMNDGTYLVADNAATVEDDVSWSMKDVLNRLGTLVDEKPEQYRRHTPALRAFYSKWKDNGMSGWGLSNMYAYEEVVEDDVLDILMIGNSYCYYYVEELYEMAKAAGIKMRVCNLYYSGCDMLQHYSWWKSGAKKYQYFEAVDGGKTEVKGVSLEWALMQRQWDVLSLQLSSTEMREYTVEESLALHREARDVLYGYLGEQYPEAKLYFHQNWSYEIGHTRDGGYVMKDLEQQIAYTAHIRDIATGVCAENNVARINTGDAWELYRAACDAAGISHNLTARLGKDTLTGEPHSGDGTHDGDIGGGQYLNAAVWYEILTGEDCRENTYVPTYTYSGTTYTLDETMMGMLKDAAHKAVNEILPTYPEFTK